MNFATDNDMDDEEDDYWTNKHLPKKPLPWGQPLGFNIIDTSLSFTRLIQEAGAHFATAKERKNKNYSRKHKAT
jgi:hypothetical protein